MTARVNKVMLVGRAGRARDLPGHRRRRAGRRARAAASTSARCTTATRSPGRWSSARCRSRCCRFLGFDGISMLAEENQGRPRADRPGDGRRAAAGRGAVHRADLGRGAAGAGPGTADQRGRPGGHGLLRRRRRWPAAHWLCDAHRASPPRSPGASPTRSSPRRRPRGCCTRWPATGSCRRSWPRCTRRAGRAGQRDPRWSRVVSLVLGLYMSTRDDGITLLSTLVNFGALTAFLLLHVVGGRALRGAARQPRLVAAPGRAGDRLR